MKHQLPPLIIIIILLLLILLLTFPNKNSPMSNNIITPSSKKNTLKPFKPKPIVWFSFIWNIAEHEGNMRSQVRTWSISMSASTCNSHIRNRDNSRAHHQLLIPKFGGNSNFRIATRKSTKRNSISTNRINERNQLEMK